MKENLLQKLERAYLVLIDEVSPPADLPTDQERANVPSVGVSGPGDDMAFADRVRLLNSATQFLAIKHRIAPEEEAPSELDNIVANYSASRTPRRRRSAAATPNGADNGDG